MAHYIDKSALVAELERRIKEIEEIGTYLSPKGTLTNLLCYIKTLEVKDPYEQCIQYASIESGIKAHAEVYSFNIESELFNQLTKEQQALWRKEIERACISGGYNGLDLAKDQRYKENLEVKEEDLEEEIERVRKTHFINDDFEKATLEGRQITNIAKHFFELGMRINNPITAADRGMAEEIIINLKRVEQDYRIDLTKEIEWVRNQVKK